MDKNLRIVARMVLSGLLVIITGGLLLTPAEASTRTNQDVPIASTSVIPYRSGDYCGPGSNNWASWMIPDHFYQADWSAICDRHDRCYSNNSLQPRKNCDRWMNDAMIKECAGAIANPDNRVRCIYRANTYYSAVRKYAKSRYHGHGSNA